MTNNCCSTCTYWNYDRYTEGKYGIGVGVCTVDGQPTFCDKHDCMFHSNEENE